MQKKDIGNDIFSGIKIRRMRVKDLKRICRIESSSFTFPWTYWLFFQEVVSPQRYYIVAELDDFVIGYAGMNWVTDEGHITTLAVDENYRNKGIGSALLRQLILKAEEKNLKYLTLEVRETNIGAQQLYMKHNFVVEGKKPQYYRNPSEDGVVMTLHLNKK